VKDASDVTGAGAAAAGEAEDADAADGAGGAGGADGRAAPANRPRVQDPPAPSRTPAATTRAPKSEQTRTLILETALRLFQERGYDRTTMRAIAKEAGVSVGNAYYYFSSKEHLVQGFYDRIAAEHREAVRPVLDHETGLEARMAGVLRSWLDIAAPYHEFAAQFFKNAADPESPLSPFSPESEHARQAAISVHREVLAGSTSRVADELADILPELLWLAQMGLVLFWVFDRSENSERSRRLADRGARLTTRGVALSRFRPLRPLAREAHELFSDFLPGMAEVAVARKARGERDSARRAEPAEDAGEAAERDAVPDAGESTDQDRLADARDVTAPGETG
jgi:AcrR family transcriptional regulator